MWLTVAGPGSWGSHGHLFVPGRYWVDDDGILESARRYADLPWVLSLEDGPPPAPGEPDHVAVMESHLVGPLQKADLHLGQPEATPEDEATGPGEAVESEAAPRPRRRR